MDLALEYAVYGHTDTGDDGTFAAAPGAGGNGDQQRLRHNFRVDRSTCLARGRRDDTVVQLSVESAT